MASQKMHQTTVRFGADLWRALEEECSGLGVSVAQFVREAALARLMYVSGRRGDPSYQLALETAGATAEESSAPPGTREPAGPQPPAHTLEREEALTSAIDRSASEISQSSALWAQARQARRRATVLRDEAARRRQPH